MSTPTIIYIILAAVAAAGLAFYFYFIGKKRKTPFPWLFGLLRFITLFAVLLLLINPKFVKDEYYVEKPELILAVDNSASIAHFGEEENVRELISAINQDEAIVERFNINQFGFGDELRNNAELNFEDSQTNIYGALASLNKLYRDKTAPILLITDGNQTYGRDYSFFTTQKSSPVIPVIAGDTTSYVDVSVNQLNVNKYAFLENRFPVEVFVNYNVEEKTTTKFQIITGNTTVYSENLELDPEQNSKIIELTLPANSVGTRTYTASIPALENERNTINNNKKFAVEVIDERSKILLLSEISHPDLGTLKRAVEVNQQRALEVKNPVGRDFDLDDYQLVILYQPNNSFNTVFEDLQNRNMNYFVITGTQTDWNFLNRAQDDFQKENSSQTENFFPLLNRNYSSFQIEDFNFQNYPPLEGVFGEISISTASNVLLFQKISGIETDQPLLVTFGDNNTKKAALFGENIWKWRMESYADTQSFEEFDDFVGKLVQYLASNQKRERLTVSYEPFYHVNDRIVISAQYFDENYVFDPRQQLVFQFQKTGGEPQSTPFVLRDNNYEVNLSSLSPGSYDFTVNIENKGLSESGSFEILDFGVEQQFLNANAGKLNQLAAEQGESLFFVSEKDKIRNMLLQDNRFIPVQKSTQTKVPLIDWFYLLIVIVISLSAEWFLRKYYGLV